MEYQALLNALKYASKTYPDEEVVFISDSLLVISQLTLQSKVGKTLSTYWKECMDILDAHPNFILEHKDRTAKELRYADSLAATVWNMEFG